MGTQSVEASPGGRDGRVAGGRGRSQRRHHGGRGRGRGGRGGRGGENHLPQHRSQKQTSDKEKENKPRHHRKPRSNCGDGRQEHLPQSREGPAGIGASRPKTADGASTPNMTTLGPTVTDSIKDLASQMQLMNDAIGNAFSPQPVDASSSEPCAKCVESSTTLGGLRSQLREAMNRAGQMNQTLALLQSHASRLHESLEMIQSQVDNANANGSTLVERPMVQGGQQPMESQVNSATSRSSAAKVENASPSTIANVAPASIRPTTVQRSTKGSKVDHKVAKSAKTGDKKEEKEREKDGSRGGPQRDATPEKPAQSFREMLWNRRNNGGHKPITTIDLGTCKNADTAIRKIETLDELIASCAPFLTGSPAEYAAWLRDELDVNSIADLSEAVADYPDMLVAGNGRVGMWQKRKFCDAVLAAKEASQVLESLGMKQSQVDANTSKPASQPTESQVNAATSRSSTTKLENASSSASTNTTLTSARPATVQRNTASSTVEHRVAKGNASVETGGRDREREGENDSSRRSPQRDATPEQPAQSFREMLWNRRNDGGQKSITTIGLGTRESTDTAARKIETLDELIASCAPFLTGSPAEYAEWLRCELNLNTIADLSEAVADYPDLLVAGNGRVGMWQKRKFCEAVLAADAASKAAPPSATAMSASAAGKEAVHPGAPSGGDGSNPSLTGNAAYCTSSNAPTTNFQNVENEGDANDDGETRNYWACRICMCINPSLFLACSACGSTGGNPIYTERRKSPPVFESKKAAPEQKAAPATFLATTPPSSMLAGMEKKKCASPTPRSSFGLALSESVASTVATPATCSSITMKTSATTTNPASCVASNVTSANEEKSLGAQAKSKEFKQADEKKRKEDKVKKQRKKAKQNKAAELARQKEEEKAAVDADKQRQMEAKLEKQKVMARHEVAVQNQQKMHKASLMKSRSAAAVVASNPFNTCVTSKEVTPQLPTKNIKSTSTSRRTTNSAAVHNNRLSLYVKTSRKGGKNRSPIFDLLQNESTVEEGRRLMVLENKTRLCKEELAELVGQKARMENGIKMEEKLISSSQQEIDTLERKAQSKWNIFGLTFFDDKTLDKKLDEIDAEEDERQQEQDKLESADEGIDNGTENEVSDDEDEDDAADDSNSEDIAVDEDKETLNENLVDSSDGLNPEKEPLLNLEELIVNCSQFLTGSPSEYVDWLHSQNIKTITDLGAAVIEDEAMLAKGGNVGLQPGSEAKFSSVILLAISGKSAAKTDAAHVSEQRENDNENVKRARTAAIKEAEEKKSKKKKGKRYESVKKYKKRIGFLKKRIEVAKETSEHQKSELQKMKSPLGNKMKLLQRLRVDIAQINGNDTEEDVNFHMDKCRDDRGFTFLMVAAQNNDFLTARTCFDLGADANTKSPEGLAAIDFSYFFGFEHVTNLIVQEGGNLPQKQCGAWSSLKSMVPQSLDSFRTWDDTLKIAETAALPAETLMESPEACEEDQDKRMQVLSPQECRGMDFTCFESRLINPKINSDLVQRVILLEQAVYNWSLSTDQTTRSNFVNALEGLKPSSVRRPGVKETRIHRRAIIGAATTYEILAARFQEGSNEENVVLFSPYVAGEVEGVTSIGVLVWAVAPDSEASLYKTLVSNTEFMRHKVKLDDRFLAHKELVLELGKDMHLLDLHSTSIWTTSTMNLYVFNVDDGDLDRIHDPGFSAKQRIVYSEEQVNKAIFRLSQAEAKDNEGILASERLDMSSLISGGAGTGKTLLMIKKVSKEDPSRRVLVVSRLPRLVNIIKTAVEEKRDSGGDNLSFTTYDDLLQLLARRVVPDSDSEYKSFVQFDRIRFDCDDSNISFTQKFITHYLNSKERKQMTNSMIEPLTLWHAIIVIKSHANCASTKSPLTLNDYASLPPSFGLKENQRHLCYSLFVKYEQWRVSGQYWDEMDRVLYILKFGPTVFREDTFLTWADRVNRFGEMDLLNDEGEPLYPFFADIVFADEAQDFTEIDLVLFAKMSSSIRSLFLSADPAQSVELGVKMREGTVNDVFHSLLKDGKQQVKEVLQYIELQTNHRTHAQNLAIGQAIRRILARSFKVPISNETALINGQLPKTLSIKKVTDLADTSIFRGGNIVFLAPDETVHGLRLQFNELGIKNDLFGVREAKGLEFDACALIGFFGFIEECGNSDQWQNLMRWLSSSSSLTKTSSTGEKVSGVMLEDCDYRLSAPNVSDEAMMLYTALTRARNQLYLIEVEVLGKGMKHRGVRLADFAFRRFKDLSLAKSVTFIDEGHVEMTSAQHKARGVLYVTQASNMSRNNEPIASIKERFREAMLKFGADKGNDKDLLDKCKKHLEAITQKHSIMHFAKEKFLVGGSYNLEGRFAQVLEFEQKASKFFSQFLCDSFLAEEVHVVRNLLDEIMDGTLYENHFKEVFINIRTLQQSF